MTKFLILDFETRSTADLKAIGAYNYALHPSTQILCAAWRVGTKETLRKAPVKCWSPAFKDSDPVQELVDGLLDSSLIVVAHNAAFERVIIESVLSRKFPALKGIPVERFKCTAAQAAALALPRDLEGACAALKLPIQKDMEGRKLILKYCKPRKPTKNNPALWHQKASDLRRIMLYCKNDILVETELFLSAPELSPAEHDVWLLDQKINDRGFKCDRAFVESALVVIEKELPRLEKEARQVTGIRDLTLNQRDKILAWLKTQGLVIPDLQAKTVADVLKVGGMPEKPTRILELRQRASKSSTKKYQAFLNQMGPDDRARGTLLYHGASTGRWTGRGLQPQNFPRAKFKNLELIHHWIHTRDPELIDAFHRPPLETLSKTLRSVIKTDKTFFGGDFSAIEARVLFWLSGHAAGLRAYHEGRDLYREIAAVIYNVKLEDVTSEQREIGKRALLGCGYGLGHKKFRQICEQFGVLVSEELAQHAVNVYRDVHSPVPTFWKLVESAAIAAVKNPGQVFNAGEKIKWVCGPRFLFAVLPSGRRLAYAFPRIKYEPAPWGEKFPRLYFWSVHPKTKKWTEGGTYGGALVENLTQATARDLMVNAMQTCERAGYETLLTVHDEILTEHQKGSLGEIEKLMTEVPKWASGCPVAVSVWSDNRYNKG